MIITALVSFIMCRLGTLLWMVVAETPISVQTADTLKSMEALDLSKGDSDGQSSVPKLSLALFYPRQLSASLPSN